MSQLGLFGDDVLPVVAPDPEALRIHARLAAHLPRRLTFGTSSWSFSGWRGQVWAGRHDSATLSRHGLPAYAQLALFGAVGLDSTFYAMPPVERLQAWAAQVPASFRFVAKAWDQLTVPVFDGPRFPGLSGTKNPRFLDASFARDEVIGPLAEGLGDRLHAVVLQLPPVSIEQLGGLDLVVQRLHAIADACAGLPPIVVEPRTRALLTDAWRDLTARDGLGHCIALHPSMPGAAAQRPWVERGRTPLVARWMLRAGSTYAAAREQFAPFDRIASPDLDTRRELLDLVLEAAESRPVTVIVNNKAEGSSPGSITALADAIAALG